VNAGRVDVNRFRNLVAYQSVPRFTAGQGDGQGDGQGAGQRGGQIVLAVDVSNWLRPDAVTSADRLFCHTYARGRGQAQMIPGWPYSVVAALESGRSSWCALLDAVRLGPADDVTEVTAVQLREVVQRLMAAGQWSAGDPPIWIVGDSGNDGPRLAFLLADLPVRLLTRLRSDRVMRFPAPPRQPGQNGRPARHGPEFSFKHATTWPEPDHTTSTLTSRYGRADAQSWDRLYPRLTHRGAWAEHPGDTPILEGTVVRLRVDHLPGDGDPKPLWLWFSDVGVTVDLVDRLWQMFLRRFDLEHTFRFLKQNLGWTRPRLRDPQAADRWTWLVIAAYTQLRLARHLVADIRRPWEKTPTKPGRLTPARVRRGFRNIRPTTALPASAPKPTRPGPGRPPGSRNTQRATRHDPGKNRKTDTAGKSQENQTG
jgi:hypothetical protein